MHEQDNEALQALLVFLLASYFSFVVVVPPGILVPCPSWFFS
jgi:hypothetical protein